MVVNTQLYAQVQSILETFGAARVPIHCVDAGLAKPMDPEKGKWPSTDGNKAWAVRFSAQVLEAEAIPHPPLPDGKRDDVWDAVLQAVCFLDTHHAAPGQAVVEACEHLARRFHTHSVDPNAHLTAGQCTTASLSTILSATKTTLDKDGQWRETTHLRPRFLLASRQPQSLERLIALLAEHGDAGEPFSRAGVEAAEAAKAMPWGPVECAMDLVPVVRVLVPPEGFDAAMAALRGVDVHLPLLDRLKDEFCREATYSGRVDAFENVYKLTSRAGQRSWHRPVLSRLLPPRATEQEGPVVLRRVRRDGRALR